MSNINQPIGSNQTKPVKISNAPMVSFNQTVLPISKKLLDRLQALLNKQPDVMADNYIAINFRDKSYSANSGGYHPVEILLNKTANERYSIMYITDFSYCGYPELERDIDFDIQNNAAFARYCGWLNIASPSVIALYKLWEGNFIAYLAIQAYDDIELSSY